MTKCSLCGSENLKVLRNKLRHDIERKVLQCAECELNFLEPKQEDLKDYYDKDYRKLYSPVLGQQLTCKELFDINRDYQNDRFDEIKSIVHKDMTAVDLGCSVGFFLDALKPHVKEAFGIEYNSEHTQYVNDNLGLKAFSEPLEKLDFPENHFDLMTAYQVFEHVEEPLEFLATIRKYLKPDGYLVLEVPNINDILISQMNNSAYQDFWYREPHVFNYSPNTFKKMLAAAGFKGEIRSISRYNFLNHLHWNTKNEPQKSVTMGTATPVLVEQEVVDNKAKTALNDWMIKVDNEYRQILREHNLGSAILFIGQMDPNFKSP